MKKSTFLLLVILLATNILSAVSPVIYVNDDAAGDNDGSCWADAFTTLQAALDAAVAGDRIWIAAGTYYPTSSYGLSGNNNRYLHFRMKEGVKIYGGFAGNENPATFNLDSRNFNLNTTILSGDVDVKGRKEDNSIHVIYHPEGLGLTGAALLDGVTVTDGYASGGGEPENSGGGICNIGSSPTFSNVIITGNFGNIAAGMYNDCSSPTLYKVTIISNSATECGGIYNTNHSLPRMVNVDISNNSARGNGGIVNVNSSPELVNVTISNNNGTGMYNFVSNPVMVNCIITGNSSSLDGGGICNINSSPELTNVTISGNYTIYRGGGLYNENSSPVLNNCIIWGNGATIMGEEIYSYQSVVTLNYCCYGNQIYGDAPVANNCITSDPKFVYPDDGDYRICGNSPCMDAGKNEYNTLPGDIRGKIRVQNDTIDIGAYEWTEGTDPLLLLKDITVYLDSLGNASIIPSDLVVKTSAAIDTLTDINSFDCSNLGDNEVKVTLVVDNTISIHDKATITVLDTIPPAFTAPPDTTIYTDADCRYNADVLYAGDVTDESDACGSGIEAVFSDQIEEGDCPGSRIITRTWELTDNSGNAAEDQVQIIHVSDTLSPFVAGNPIKVYLNEDGKYTLTMNDIENISAGTTDNCTAKKDLEIIVTPDSFQCVNFNQDVAVEVTATDLCGNQSGTWTTVTVYDTIAPVVAASPVEVCLRKNGQYLLSKNDIKNIARGTMDNCTAEEDLELIVIPESFQCTHAGQDVALKLIAKDLCGNTASTWTKVTVRDAIAPEIEPVANMTVVAEPGRDYAEIDYPEINVTDNCGVTLEQLSGVGEGGLFPSGTTTEIWQASDAAGNTDMVSFTVTVTTVNSPPHLISPVADHTVHAGDILKILLSSVPGEMFEDYDSDALTLTVVEEGTDTLPEWAVMQCDTLVCEPMPADTGCVNIAVTAADASGSTATDTFSICIDDSPVFTDYQSSGVFEIQMYPNPTKDIVNIDFSSGFYKADLSVIDMTGKVVLWKLFETGEKITFNMADKISGIYLVKLDFNNRQIIRKLVVNKAKY
jgi:hypothetical protein